MPVAGAMLLGAVWWGPPAEACASSHIRILLAGFAAEANAQVGQYFYWVPEEAGNADFVVKRLSHECPPEITLATADYTQSHVTTDDSDFVRQTGTTYDLHDPEHGEPGLDEQTISIPIVDDLQTEASVETATVLLTGTSDNALLIDPSSAPLYIIDNDGPTRLIMDPPGSYSQSETWTQVRVPVFRAGDATAPTTVQYSVTPGTAGDPAEPGQDYMATTPGTLTFDSGVRAQPITFSILNDDDAEPPETVDVSLSVEPPISMTLTILDNEESIDPVTRWHHPRQGFTYRYGDFRLREMHVFAKDEGGSEVVGIQMALRKRFKNGSCAWWTPGSGFVRGPCSAKLWMPMVDGGPGLENWPYFYVKRFPRLTPSIGTKVRNYTAWCRATDGAGNVESAFVRGRNLSTFEVARRS